MRNAVFRLFVVGGLCALLSSAPQQGHAASVEYQVKAVLLFNFAKFVEWPAGALAAGAPITIGVLGQDPFGEVLDQAVKGKTVNGRTLEVKRFAGAPGPCQILFISASEKDRLAQILESLKSASVLTVSETEGFAKTGGMVNFTLDGGKVRFELNPDNAEGAGLKVSPELLKSAIVVKN